MSGTERARVLAIMGSGETSPTMVTIHKALVARLGNPGPGASGGQGRAPGQQEGTASGPRGPTAILLDTPYAFQENAADISARAQAYFARSVGLRVSVVSEALDQPAADRALAAIRGADWVFAGPGSPSYALRRWRGRPVAEALRDRIAAGAGITVIASAAAAAIGLLAVPVYEIYKVGADPYWLDGLDLMGVLGLRVAVIPHYDNAEGGTHDTRFCYLGERRLAMLEPALPADAAVLGVDEHTAAIIDLAAEEAEVAGRGGMTIRKAGRSAVFPAGTRIALADLRDLVRAGVAGHDRRMRPLLASEQPPAPPRGAAPSSRSGQRVPRPSAGDDPAASLPEATRAAQARFEDAARARDGAAMAAAVLDLEAAIVAWSTDTDENDDADRARAVLRGLIVRLGQAAQRGLADPADQLRPMVEPLLTLRDSLRRDGSYGPADAIRDALAAAGVVLQDFPDRTSWTLG